VYIEILNPVGRRARRMGDRAAIAPHYPHAMQSLATFTGFKPAAAPRQRLSAPRARAAATRAAVVVEAKKKSVGDLAESDLKGQTVFVRCDLNVPMDADLNITDDTRIRAAIPTLEYLAKNGAKVLVTSHLVRDHRDRRARVEEGGLSTYPRIGSRRTRGDEARATDEGDDDARKNRADRRTDRRISSD
jgi:hypothetical protein